MTKVRTSFGVIALVLLAMSMIPASFAIGGHATSSEVLVINASGDVWGQGWAGPFPDSAVTGAGYTVDYMAASSVVNASSFGSADTIVLWEYCQVGTAITLQNALITFLQNGGKLIIWDSDSCNTQGGTAADYAWLSTIGAGFTTSSPGQTGSSGGSLTIEENNNFLTGITQSNLNSLVAGTDAVGDLNVIVTKSANWCATLEGTNILGASGFADAYTAPGSLTGAAYALIVYDGLDTDEIGYGSGAVMTSLILNQLAHGWGDPAYTSDLACSVPIPTGVPEFGVSAPIIAALGVVGMIALRTMVVRKNVV